MNKNELNVEIHNQEELLRVYENDEKNAKNNSEKAKYEERVEETKNEISDLMDKELNK
ncbi:hypothetical protein [Clostridium sp. SM-530-WT-3G]|uniref:hypothetical protein n=1 Tax=Clostridium sp. SM-530-WT-3G TaxID=2725303 RepID=UPI00145F4E92|nr:hypothetical protein [Clostridium sp. SM-530-WT-3G]NME83608.1 hypothetical protein [Clostridium sp. SM-530-WT-3G]